MKDNITVANMQDISPIIEEALQSGADVRLTVTGNSMYPMLRDNIDSVILKKAEPNKIKKYDIPLYKRDSGQYVLHRVIKIKKEEYYLNGDNQTFIEYPIYNRQIIALVKGFYRNGRYFSSSNIIYRIYAWVWVMGLPFRKKMMNVYLYFAKILYKLSRNGDKSER